MFFRKDAELSLKSMFLTISETNPLTLENRVEFHVKSRSEDNEKEIFSRSAGEEI